MAIHVFIDDSNIYGGIQTAANDLEPAANKGALRLYYRNFFTLIEAGRTAETKVLASSVTQNNNAVFGFATAGGYETDLLQRISNEDGTASEQAVDEILHLRIANALLDYEAPQTLVLATGDGREHRRDCSFPRQVRRALRRGWDVELYSWAGSLSPAFANIPITASGRLEIRHLNSHYQSITFFKGGTSSLKGNEFTLGERRACPLNLQPNGQYW